MEATKDEVNDIEAIHLGKLLTGMNLGREKNPCPVFHPFLLPSSWKFIESAFCTLLSLSGIISPFVPQTVFNLNYKLKLPSSEKQPEIPSLVSLPLLCVLLGPGLSSFHPAL